MGRDKPSMTIVLVTVVLILGIGYLATVGTLEKYSEPEKNDFIVGTSTPFPPFEYRAGDNSDVVGIDIDLARMIAEKMNKKLVIRDYSDFNSLLPALESGEVDMIAGGMSVTEERKSNADFSDSYYKTKQTVMTAKESSFSCYGPCGPSNFANLTIGYQVGTTSEDWIEGKLNATVESTRPFNDLQMGLQLLKLGLVDTIIVDEVAAKSFAGRNPDLKVAGTIESDENYAFAVKKGDPQKILPAANAVISELKNGEGYQKLLEKWWR